MVHHHGCHTLPHSKGNPLTLEEGGMEGGFSESATQRIIREENVLGVSANDK